MVGKKHYNVTIYVNELVEQNNQIPTIVDHYNFMYAGKATG